MSFQESIHVGPAFFWCRLESRALRLRPTALSRKRPLSALDGPDDGQGGRLSRRPRRVVFGEDLESEGPTRIISWSVISKGLRYSASKLLGDPPSIDVEHRRGFTILRTVGPSTPHVETHDRWSACAYSVAEDDEARAPSPDGRRDTLNVMMGRLHGLLARWRGIMPLDRADYPQGKERSLDNLDALTSANAPSGRVACLRVRG